MEVNIQIERQPKPLDKRGRLGLGRFTGMSCFFDQMRSDNAVDDAQHRGYNQP